MVDSRVKGLRVTEVGADEVYDVYALITNTNGGTDYFLLYNDRLRKEGKGFIYMDVRDCMPVEDKVALME